MARKTIQLILLSVLSSAAAGRIRLIFSLPWLCKGGKRITQTKFGQQRRIKQTILNTILLFFLIACAQEIAKQEEQKQAEQQSFPEISFEKEIPVYEVKTQTKTYKLSADNRILAIEPEWSFFYKNDKLIRITGPSQIEINYDKNLNNITINGKELIFRHDSRGRLSEVKGGRENLYFEYDNIDNLRGVRRGVAVRTSIDYDKQGKIKYLTRGPITVNVYYNNHSLVNNFDADDTKFILAYWRDDKLSSLSGKTFGLGLNIGYGAYPPKEAKIVHSTDNTEFKADSTAALYTVVDYYLYCNYISKHKDLLFDGTSYTFYTNYFKGSTTEYFIMQTVCEAFEN